MRKALEMLKFYAHLALIVGVIIAFATLSYACSTFRWTL